MTVSIRAHHLLCILTYLGKGYSTRFVGNYNRIVKRINSGEPLLLVEGPDEICGPMLGEEGCHCHNDSVRDRDRTAAVEIGKALGLHLNADASFVLTAGQLADCRKAFAQGTIRSACSGCEWAEFCSDIARNEFGGCRLAPPD
ncbi:DUF1284 domain-containing protein [Roseibium sp.]|uniref:DUF1284 domain-containing protein n=1 Tax=Roseibium sp. TaxID=1936156 RepID=UPI003D0DB206